MALIAFCAIALVENVTNAHPVGREGRRGGRDGGTVEGRREEGRRAGGGGGGGGKTRKNKNKTKGLDMSLL